MAGAATAADAVPPVPTPAASSAADGDSPVASLPADGSRLLPPTVSTAADAPPAIEAPVVESAPPLGDEPEAGDELVEPAVAAASPTDTLNVTDLLTRLRKTKAINLRTKLAVKNESDDLLDRFRAYHEQHDTAALGELRRSYDSLFSKLSSLLEDADPPLARDIDRSRAAIWAILTDPIKFGVSTEGVPPA
jgi:hypothetical protein